MEDPSKWVEDNENGYSEQEHREERAKNGFSWADWINFDTYIAWVIANAVQKMKDDGHTMFSFPGVPDSEWERMTHEEYDIMIKGFGGWADDKFNAKSGESYEEQIENLDEALDIFKKRFKSLWD